MSSAEQDRWFKRHFPSVSRQSILRHYIPMLGGVSHSVFAVQVLNPSFLQSVVGEYDLAVAHALFINSHFGVGLYVYYRQHMSTVSTKTRVMYSIYTSVLMNFGSVLLYGATKDLVLPRNIYLRAAFGLITSFAVLSIGMDYLGYIDRLSGKTETQTE